MTDCKDESTEVVSGDQALNDTITWRSEFSTRRPINGICDDEEIPWLELRAELFKDEETDEEAGEERGESEQDNNIHLFMRDDEVPDFLQSEAEMVEEYTYGATLKQLKADKWTGPALLRKTWVGEGGADWFRTSPEWLTAYDSYHRLRVPRFSSCLRSQDQLETSTAQSSSAVQRDPATNIERRLIFVSDLDKYNIYALAGTASINQHAALRNTFSRYLAFKPSMEVNIATRGWPNFQFSLHLPYYAWRCSPAPKWDSRRDRSGRPLRQFKDVSVLNGNGENAFLYEAQISCVLVGIDEWTYVAYCFVDTFFDGDDGEVDSQYHKDILDGAEYTQPVLYGRPERPTHKARDFFLRVFQIRVQQICQEWGRVVQKLEQSIRNSRANSREPTGTHATAETTERYIEDIRTELIWIEDTSDVLFDLRDMLKKTLNEWNKFTHYQSTFRDSSAGDCSQQSFCPIQKQFDQLAVISESLQSLADRCTNREQKLRRKLTRHDINFREEQRKLAETSHQLAEVSKKMSLTMMFSFPLALTAAIFSMQDRVIPFPLSRLSFLIAFIVLGILCLAIYHFDFYRDPCQKRCTRIFGRVCSQYTQIYQMLTASQFAVRAVSSLSDAESGGTELPTFRFDGERPRYRRPSAFGESYPSDSVPRPRPAHILR